MLIKTGVYIQRWGIMVGIFWYPKMKPKLVMFCQTILPRNIAIFMVYSLLLD